MSYTNLPLTFGRLCVVVRVIIQQNIDGTHLFLRKWTRAWRNSLLVNIYINGL